jgi:hypothetical protein
MNNLPEAHYMCDSEQTASKYCMTLEGEAEAASLRTFYYSCQHSGEF